jgi:hypothetical protein
MSGQVVPSSESFNHQIVAMTAPSESPPPLSFDNLNEAQQRTLTDFRGRIKQLHENYDPDDQIYGDIALL